MREPKTPEELLGSASKEPLEIVLRCARCRTAAVHHVPWATVDPRADPRGADGWDGVFLPRIFTCSSCGAVDEYEVGDVSRLRLLLEMTEGTEGVRAGARVLGAASRLWDGTEPRRPTQALTHLRALAARDPTNPEAWRRLGNLCERYGLPDETLAAWRTAVEVGPEEFEAAYGLATDPRRHASQERANAALRYLGIAVARFPGAKDYDAERRLEFAESIATHLFEVADESDGPIVLLATWEQGQRGDAVVVNMSSAELGELERRDTLGAFLARPDVIGLQLVDRVDSDEPTRLEQLLDGVAIDPGIEIERGLFGKAMARSAPVRVAPRPGRNDPCPCGSGKKYKRCHGR